tara:strand:- start:183 stop:746 length:564 start_codon:yes stop_codon:yes gene_type:complete
MHASTGTNIFDETELKMHKIFKTAVICGLGAGFLTACQYNGTAKPDVTATKKMAAVEASQTQTIVNLKDVLDASAENIPTLTAVGYAVTSTQPGRVEAQKRLMAIRSARMAAMRDLAEQIHGLKVDSNTTVIDLVVQNDTFRGVVNGTIRGARTVRINPTGSDTYEVVLEIDRETIGYLLSTAREAV